MIGSIELSSNKKNYNSLMEFHAEKISESETKIKILFEKMVVKSNFPIEYAPYDVCVLPGSKILCADCDAKLLVLYDKDYSLLKVIKKINRKIIQPTSLALNEESRHLYIAEVAHHQILMTDLNFSLIKSIGCRGDSIDNFCAPFSICYKHRYLYVCDTFNQRIKIYTHDLKFVESINLSFQPFSIQISDSSICVNCKYFYDIINLDIVNEYEHDFQKVSEINSCFYACDFKLNTLFCFDKRGKQIWQMHKRSFIDIIPNGKLFLLDNNLIVTSYTHKKFYKLMDAEGGNNFW